MGIAAIRESSDDARMTWSRIRQNLDEQYTELTKMKFVPPKAEEEEISKELGKIGKSIVKGFQSLKKNF